MSNAFIKATKNAIEEIYNLMKDNMRLSSNPIREVEIEDTSWGTIGAVQNKKVYITRETWAPGIWAGMNGQYIKSDEGMIYQIREVDLQDRSVILDHVTNLKEGTKVYFGDD